MGSLSPPILHDRERSAGGPTAQLSRAMLRDNQIGRYRNARLIPSSNGSTYRSSLISRRLHMWPFLDKGLHYV
jgi:hypothetical protein